MVKKFFRIGGDVGLIISAKEECESELVKPRMASYYACSTKSIVGQKSVAFIDIPSTIRD